jgi:hypothetical protein
MGMKGTQVVSEVVVSQADNRNVDIDQAFSDIIIRPI